MSEGGREGVRVGGREGGRERACGCHTSVRDYGFVSE